MLKGRLSLWGTGAWGLGNGVEQVDGGTGELEQVWARPVSPLEVPGQRGRGRLLCGTAWALATWRKLAPAAESWASDTDMLRVEA